MVRTLGTEFAHFLLGQHGETATSSETFPRPRCAALTAPRVGRSPRPAVARPASRRSQSHARKSPRDRAAQPARRPAHPPLGPARPAGPGELHPDQPRLRSRGAHPGKHRGRLRGANISPVLNWTQPPASTAELVLIVQDPDVPFGKPATHALTLGIDPSLNGIPENGLTDPSPIPGIRHGKGAMGKRGWAGPLPPRSHGPHSYVFQLFALDQAPGLPASCTSMR
jgi:phosphatidylethanolamine-binding protein (PEBP) family uncharacterized protein